MRESFLSSLDVSLLNAVNYFIYFRTKHSYTKQPMDSKDRTQIDVK